MFGNKCWCSCNQIQCGMSEYVLPWAPFGFDDAVGKLRDTVSDLLDYRFSLVKGSLAFHAQRMDTDTCD